MTTLKSAQCRPLCAEAEVQPLGTELGVLPGKARSLQLKTRDKESPNSGEGLRLHIPKMQRMMLAWNDRRELLSMQSQACCLGRGSQLGYRG